MIDHHRGLRRGHPETIFCSNKTINQIKGIAQRMLKRDINVMATRAGREVYEALKELTDRVEYHELARIVVINRKEIKKTKSKIFVITAGTADIPVSEETAVTVDVMGNTVERLYDVGVAGIRSHQRRLRGEFWRVFRPVGHAQQLRKRRNGG